ncbi:MAG TPA: ABC transporter ATP-binding protein [Firmicutes bacterium]|nr:ABC transporter ATP-binding protein [Bacillota bacterium]
MRDTMMLELRGVSKSFGGIKAITDLSMEVAEGEIVGLIGPNGAGKTTVFNLVTGVYRPDSGEIVFRGESVGGLPPHVIVSKGVARTFQNIRLFNNLSVLDNVKIALHSQPEYGLGAALAGLGKVAIENKRIVAKAREFLDMVGLSDRAKLRAGALPYGLARRLEIARALALNPRLLLLDEPAAGMNPDEIADLKELILKIHKDFNLTIVLIEHRMDLVMATCPRLVVLNFGTKIAEGSPEEIQTNPQVLQAYLGEDY